MSWMNLELIGGKVSFRPEETVRGTVRWEVESPIERVEVRLFWYTSGKGTRDVEVASSTVWDSPGNAEKREFDFRLPQAPFSFSGKLISLLWAVEAVTEPPGEVARAEIVVSPTGEEIVLPTLPEEKEAVRFQFKPGGH